MQIESVLNGERTRVPADCNVAELVAQRGLGDGPIAVERNERVVRRAEHARTQLAQGDRVEVVTLVGGG